VGKTEALHWNGTAWSAFSVPVPGGGIPAVFSAVAAGSANDVWIAGDYLEAGGRSWHPVPAPVSGLLLSVTGISQANVWAFGRSTNSQGVVSNLTLRNG
jgi:hypothetical protein